MLSGVRALPVGPEAVLYIYPFDIDGCLSEADGVAINQGVTNKCSLSWLTNSALVCEPKCEGEEGLRVSAYEYSCTQEPKQTLEIYHI